MISDLTGTTGLAILKAILTGERDVRQLVKLRDRRVKASKTAVAKSLVGDYRAEHLFTLGQSLKSYQHYQGLIADVDQEIGARLRAFDSQVDLVKNPLPPATKPERHQPSTNLRAELYRLTGVDLTAIPGIQASTVHTLFAEIGRDVSKFPSAKHFASWLGLSPENRISGGRILSVKTRTVASRAARALRMAALGLYRSQNSMGDFFRRMRAKLGTPKAITATAHKLARIIYHLLRTKSPFDQTKFARHEQQYRNRMEAKLKQQAKAFGFALVPV